MNLASPLGVAFTHPRTGQRFQLRAKGDLVRRMAREMESQAKANQEEIVMSKAQREAASAEFRSGTMPMFPTTFVSAPLSKYPRGISDFLAYQWHRTKSWFASRMSVAGAKVDSMGKKWTTRPRLKLHRGQIAPTAKIMYRELLEAFAAGDKATIRKLCTPAYADKFLVAIERRRPDERLHFEVVKDSSSLFYPRLSSHMIGDGSFYEKGTLLEQAVVAISMTQKVWKTKAKTGETIPGSEKVQDRVEYVVMWRDIKTGTYTRSPWRIWGTTAPTSLETMRERAKFWEKQQAKMAGWKTD